jgi:hypothetical protein
MSDIDNLPSWFDVQDCLCLIDDLIQARDEVLKEADTSERAKPFFTAFYKFRITQAQKQLAIYGYAYDGTTLSDVPRIVASAPFGE